MDTTTYAILAIVVILTIYLWLRRHDPRLPPCPVTPLPIFGHLFHLGSNPRPVFKLWHQTCGDIYSLYFGQKLIIVLNGYDVHREILVKNADHFSDRPHTLFDQLTSSKPGLGIILSSGDIWKENRAVTVAILRALGMGKLSMAEKISEIAATNNELIANLKGAATDIYDIINTSVSNVICYIVMGHNFRHDDEEFLKACRYIRHNIEDADGRNFANYFPCLLKFPGDLFKAHKIRERARFVMDTFLDPFIKDRSSASLHEHDMNDFISHYIFQRNKKFKAGEFTYLDDINLRTIIHDLFNAGVDTTSNTIMFGILYFLYYPEVQEKIYLEIQKVVGTERPPNMSDGNELHYLNAFIKELQRIVSLVPWSVMHVCTETTYFRGYTIPKGAWIIPNLDSILYDENIWGKDVDKLRPERFLDENGKLKNPEEFVPFSMGRRICAGESLAKMEMFLFLSRMIQRFKFMPVDPESLPPLTEVFGITTSPSPFKVRAVDRKHM